MVNRDVAYFTAPFNNMRTLKFKAQPTNAFFATVNQMLGGSSQLPTTAERAVFKSLSAVQTTKQCSAVVVSWEEPPNVWLTAAKNAFVGWALNFRVRMLSKSAVSLDRPGVSVTIRAFHVYNGGLKLQVQCSYYRCYISQLLRAVIGQF